MNKYGECRCFSHRSECKNRWSTVGFRDGKPHWKGPTMRMACGNKSSGITEAKIPSLPVFLLLLSLWIVLTIYNLYDYNTSSLFWKYELFIDIKRFDEKLLQSYGNSHSVSQIDISIFTSLMECIFCIDCLCFDRNSSTDSFIFEECLFQLRNPYNLPPFGHVCFLYDSDLYLNASAIEYKQKI